MFARLSLFAMVAALGANVAATVCRTTYTVVSGDNCVAIAKKFNVPDATLIAANPAVDANCDNIFVGQQLCIPFCQADYTVATNDNCIAIAAKFNVSDAALLAANSPYVSATCNNIFVGEQLCIPLGCATQYTVKSGDVCISIANQFSITATELEAANTQIDPLCDNLQVGESLCIPAANSTSSA